MMSNTNKRAVMNPDDYDYLEKLSETEGCVTMPSPYKPIPRNDNQHYNTYIKNVVVGKMSPSKPFQENKATGFPNAFATQVHGSQQTQPTETKTYEHPVHKGMICVVGFEPGPARPVGKPINPPNHFPTTVKELNDLRALQRNISTQQTNTQDDKPFPMTQLTNLSQSQQTQAQSKVTETSSTEYNVTMKPPPYLYPNSIVDTFNDAVFEAATDSSVVQKLTEFTEYEECNKVVTTTYLFNPFHRHEIEEKLNIKIAEKKRNSPESPIYSPRASKRVCIVTTAWRDETQAMKQFR